MGKRAWRTNPLWWRLGKKVKGQVSWPSLCGSQSGCGSELKVADWNNSRRTNLTPGTAISLPLRTAFGGDFSEEMRKKAVQWQKRRNHLSSVLTVSWQCLDCLVCIHTYNVLVIIPSPWTTTLIFTRVKMEAQRDEWRQFAQGHFADKEPNWNSLSSQPPSKVHVLCTPPPYFWCKIFSWVVVDHLM